MRIADRVVILVSLLFGVILASMSAALWFLLENGISKAVVQQQFATLEASVDDLDNRLSSSHAILIAAAQTLTPEVLERTVSSQSWLDSREGLTEVFDDHLYIFSPTGDILVEAPYTPDRRGKSIAFRSYFQKTVASLQPQISEPFLTTLSHHHPTVMMTVPVFDREHRLIAILGGSIDLLEENMIGRIGERGRRLGGYYTLTTRDRIVIAHPEQSRIFSTLLPGRNTALDQALDGFEGSVDRVNHAGVRVFTSVKQMHSVPWLMMLSYPRDDVLSSLRPLLLWLPGIALFCLVAAASITRKVIRDRLAPLRTITDHLASMGQRQDSSRFLPERGSAEFVLLSQTFNKLVRTLDEKNADLVAKEQLYRILAEFTSDTVFWRDQDGKLLYISENALQLTGWPAETFIERPTLLDEIVHEEDFVLWKTHVHNVDDDGWTMPIEFRIMAASGEIRWVSHICHPITGSQGEFLGYRGSHRDVTRNKQEERRQRLAASVFFSARESILVTNPKGEIQAANPAFVTLTGYQEGDVLGQTPRIFKSGAHPPEFYEEFWQTLIHHGCWQGEITNRRRNGDVFVASTHIEAVRDADGQLIHYICGQHDVTRLKNVENHMAYMMNHDVLTALFNRTALEQQGDMLLGSSRLAKTPTSLMFIDLDRFKDVNESLGHGVGDILLTQLSQRLLAMVRSCDLVARVGGDEFGLVFPDLERQAARDLAEKIQNGLRDPFIVDQHRLSISVSIGIAIYPEDGNTISELLRNADTAVYEAKSEGRNAIVFYRPAMNEAIYGMLLLETELRRAISEGELLTYYQPKLELASLKPVGAEALIRWKHPERGLISPGEFIPVAERSGLISEIGDWVLQDVCRQLSLWREQGDPLFPVAVNLSAFQFRNPELPARIANLLCLYELDPELLELELTETTLLVAGSQVMENLAALHNMGVSLAIDDFGTGYSSLSYLKRMPIDILKIDQSFVRDLENSADDQALVLSIVSLGHSLGLKVVAEGVETSSQATMLDQHGCDVAQGFLYAPPMPAEHYIKWLDVGTCRPLLN